MSAVSDTSPAAADCGQAARIGPKRKRRPAHKKAAGESALTTSATHDLRPLPVPSQAPLYAANAEDCNAEVVACAAPRSPSATSSDTVVPPCPLSETHAGALSSSDHSRSASGQPLGGIVSLLADLSGAVTPPEPATPPGSRISSATLPLPPSAAAAWSPECTATPLSTAPSPQCPASPVPSREALLSMPVCEAASPDGVATEADVWRLLAEVDVLLAPHNRHKHKGEAFQSCKGPARARVHALGGALRSVLEGRGHASRGAAAPGLDADAWALAGSPDAAAAAATPLLLLRALASTQGQLAAAQRELAEARAALAEATGAARPLPGADALRLADAARPPPVPLLAAPPAATRLRIRPPSVPVLAEPLGAGAPTPGIAFGRPLSCGAIDALPLAAPPPPVAPPFAPPLAPEAAAVVGTGDRAALDSVWAAWGPGWGGSSLSPGGSSGGGGGVMDGDALAGAGAAGPSLAVHAESADPPLPDPRRRGVSGASADSPWGAPDPCGAGGLPAPHPPLSVYAASSPAPPRGWQVPLVCPATEPPAHHAATAPGPAAVGLEEAAAGDAAAAAAMEAAVAAIVGGVLCSPQRGGSPLPLPPVAT